MLNRLMFNILMLNRLMFNILMLNRLVLNSLVLNGLYDFMLCRFMLNLFVLLSSMFSGFMLFLFGSLLIFSVSLLSFFLLLAPDYFLVGLFELLGNEADSRPVLSVILMLSSHLDEEAASKYFLIVAGLDEVNCVDLGLEDDFEGSRVVFFDLYEVEFGESFLDVFLESIEVAFDQV